jgi:hypothetical protein
MNAMRTKFFPMPILVVLGLGASSLAGCSSQSHWVKDGGSAADLNYDQGTCEHLARLRNRSYEDAPGGIIVAEFYDDCMNHFGWTLQTGKTG